MDRLRVAASKLQEWTQSDFQVLKAPGFSEDFLFSSCDRIDERIVFPNKIDG